jgi:outer membrane protein assembly factor BamB
MQTIDSGYDKLLDAEPNQELVDSNTVSNHEQATRNSINDSKTSGTPRKSNSWPMFLFDASRTGNGSSNAPENNSILWSTPEVGGNGYPSIVVADGKVFSHKGSYGILYALFENNGTIIWNKSIGISGSTSSTPAVVNGKVYVVGDKLYCFDANSGTELWNHSVAGHDVGTSSPVVSNGKVFVNSQTLYCINANTGKEIWKKFVGGMGYSSPAVSNGWVVVNGNYLLCLYENNGNELWNISTIGSNSPVIANGLVYHNPESIQCLFLNNGTERWSQPEGGDEYSSPVVNNNNVYVNKFGMIYCYNAYNGTKIWNRRIGVAYTSPALSKNGKLVIIGGNTTYCIYQNNGTELWNVTIKGLGYPSPAIANGRIFVNLGTVYCIGPKGIDKASPIVLGEYPKDGSVNVSPFSRIRVTFNESMNKTSTEAAFSISPELEGSIHWQKDTIIIEPTTHMSKSTVYTVTITTAAKDTSGNNLDGNGNGIFDGATADKFTFSFVTRDRVLPQITSIEPQNNEENIGLGSVIKISFTDPMDHAATEGAFSSSPKLAGGFEWAGNTLTFIPKNALDPGITYNITIRTSAVDAIGNPLDGDYDDIDDGSPEDDYSWSFKTIEGTPPTVQTISPPDHAFDIPITSTIRVTFSEPMNQTSVEEAFSISPALQGSILWLGETMEFTPIQELNFETKYEIKISTLAKDLVGNTLDGNGDGIGEDSTMDDYEANFKTRSLIDEIPPIVQFTTPSDIKVNVDVWSKIVIHFSEPMNRTSTENSIHTIPSISGDFYWDILGLELSLVPDRYLAFYTKYTLTLDGAMARDTSGNTLDGNTNRISEGAPADNYSWLFRTVSQPVNETTSPIVLATNPSDRSIDVDIDTIIEITFNEEMNKTATEAAFSFLPSTPGILIWENTTMIFQPSSVFEYNTTYTVLVKSNATDLSGSFLDGNFDLITEGSPIDDFSWEFTTISKENSELFEIVITGTTKIEISLGVSTSYIYTITNQGTITDTILPSFEAGGLNEHVQLDKHNPESLEPKSNMDIQLLLTIPENIDPGYYNLTIIANSLEWNISVSYNVELLISSKENENDGQESDDIFGQILVGAAIIIGLIIVIIIIVMFRIRRNKNNGPNKLDSQGQTPIITTESENNTKKPDN